MKPTKLPIKPADLDQLKPGQYIYQRKYDGQFQVRKLPIGGSVCEVAGELVKAKSGGFFTHGDQRLLTRGTLTRQNSTLSTFYAVFDVLSVGGFDVRHYPLKARWQFLNEEISRMGPVFNASNSGERIVLAESSTDPLFFNHVIAAGGEGIVAKDWQSDYFAPMLACKRMETHYCVVVGFCGGTQSVRVAPMHGGMSLVGLVREDVLKVVACVEESKVSLFGGKIDRVRVGSIIKVEAMGLTAAGRLREPRVCQDSPDSWLVKF